MQPVKKNVPSLPVDNVRILGKTFSVRQLTEEELADKCGIMDISSQEIAVGLYKSAEFVQDTLLHECIHGIDEVLGLNLSERQVFQLTAGLLAFLKDNKEVANWLIKDEK